MFTRTMVAFGLFGVGNAVVILVFAWVDAWGGGGVVCPHTRYGTNCTLNHLVLCLAVIEVVWADLCIHQLQHC